MTRIHQMPLALKPPRKPRFDNYILGANAMVVETLVSGLQPSDVYLLMGPSGSGRSHLLSALFNQTIDSGESCSFVPLGDASGWALLDHVSAPIVVVDDIDTLAGDSEGEIQLFNALNRWRGEKITVVMSAGSLAAFVLPDLCSRLKQATRLTLRTLDENDLQHLVQRLAADQDIEMSADVARYLVSRVTRNAKEITEGMNELMLQALSERRAITIPMVRSRLQMMS